jgi:acyl carrier protein
MKAEFRTATSGFPSGLIERIARDYTNVETIHRGITSLRSHKNAKEENRNEAGIFSGGNNPAQGNLESAVARIWSEQIGTEISSVNQNFFDCGGKSIMLPYIAAKLKEQIGVNVSIVDLFQFPTVALLSKHLESSNVSNIKVETTGTLAARQREALLKMRKKSGR